MVATADFEKYRQQLLTDVRLHCRVWETIVRKKDVLDFILRVQDREELIQGLLSFLGKVWCLD
jgi:hypothetical protein